MIKDLTPTSLTVEQHTWPYSYQTRAAEATAKDHTTKCAQDGSSNHDITTPAGNLVAEPVLKKFQQHPVVQSELKSLVDSLYKCAKN